MAAEVVNPWTWQEQYGFVHGNVVPAGARTLYVAGQASTDDDGNPIHAGDIVAQVSQSIDHVERVLQQAGMTLADVVRMNVYTTDVQGFFGAHPTLVARFDAAGCKPASTLLGVTALAFPEMLVELEATAVG